MRISVGIGQVGKKFVYVFQLLTNAEDKADGLGLVLVQLDYFEQVLIAKVEIYNGFTEFVGIFYFFLTAADIGCSLVVFENEI